MVAAVTAGLALVLPCATMPAAAAAPDAARGVSVTAITVAADYMRSHAVYAMARVPNCQAACAELLRSRDGGATWTKARARGWQPGGLTSVMFHGAAALIAWWQNTVALSLDGGDTFTPYTASGSPSAAAADGDNVDVLSADGSGAHLLTLPAASDRTVSGAPGLDSASIELTTAYPGTSAHVPAAIALGVDHASGSARLEPCDASLSCAAPIPVPSGGAIVSSPAFSHDLTFFLLGAQSLLRSSDGGHSLAPITVVAPGPETVITSVTGLVFSPDFDRTTHRGVVYAGVISVSRATHGGSVSGGVFRSADAGATWVRSSAATDFPGGVSALALAPDGRVFAGTYEFGNGAGGVYCSAGGDSWSDGCPAYPSPARSGGGGTLTGRTGSSPSLQTTSGAGPSSATAPGRGKPIALSSHDAVKAPGSAAGRTAVGVGLLALALVAGAGVLAGRRRRRSGRVALME